MSMFSEGVVVLRVNMLISPNLYRQLEAYTLFHFGIIPNLYRQLEAYNVFLIGKIPNLYRFNFSAPKFTANIS